MNIFDDYKSHYVSHKAEEISVLEYLELCKEDKMAYASSAERMLAAIG